MQTWLQQARTGAMSDLIAPDAYHSRLAQCGLWSVSLTCFTQAAQGVRGYTHMQLCIKAVCMHMHAV